MTGRINTLFVETTDRFEYAANVVAQSLKSSPAAWFWYGNATRIIRFFDTFAWRTFWVSRDSPCRKTQYAQPRRLGSNASKFQDFVFYREFNLEKVRAAHLARVKKQV